MVAFFRVDYQGSFSTKEVHDNNEIFVGPKANEFDLSQIWR